MTSQHTIRRRMAATTPVLLALILLAFVLAALALGDRAIARMAAETLIRVTMVVGFWVFVGNSGVVSFGHAAFGCIGAYVSAWLTLRPDMKATLLPGLPEMIAAADWPVLPAALAGGGAAALVAPVGDRGVHRHLRLPCDGQHDLGELDASDGGDVFGRGS